MEVTQAERNRTAQALLERIIDAPSNLVVLEGVQAEELIEHFRKLARRSGQALYLWKEDWGLRSLRDGAMQVQVSASLSDSLRFILRSMHFGVYLMQLDTSRLSLDEINRLVEIGRLRDGPSRRVVLLGQHDVLDPRLASVSLGMRLTGSERAKPRLRDGRWVQ